MNIREELLREHTKQNALNIAAYACKSATNLKELMDCFIDPEYRVAQRAAWSVTWAAIKNPSLIEPYIQTLVDQLPKKDIHPAVIRNSLRVLQQLEIPETYHGALMNSCFQFLEWNTAPIAVKAFAMTNLHNLSAHYPEIKEELKLIIKERWDVETAAFRARGKKILNS